MTDFHFPSRPIFAVSLFAWASFVGAADEWPQFRGPTGQGLSDAHGLPLTWDETNGIAWKTEIPGRGYSSPVVSENRIWLTSSPDKGLTRHVLCVDLDSGKVTKDVPLFSVEKPELCHAFNSYATPTPVLERGRVYVTFGTPGTACLDAETGSIIWQRRDFAVDYRDVGAASSPILYRDKLILTCDGQTGSKQFVAALDKNTGKTLWQTDRTFAPSPAPTSIHFLRRTARHPRRRARRTGESGRAPDAKSGRANCPASIWPRRLPRTAASFSSRAAKRLASSPSETPSACSRPINSTTGAWRHPPSSAARSSCARPSTSTASRLSENPRLAAQHDRAMRIGWLFFVLPPPSDFVTMTLFRR